MIQVGLVGVGSEWDRYRPVLSRLRQPIQVEAVYDPVFARAETVAKNLEADPVTGLQALARRGDVEAILVMDPGWARSAVLPLLARNEKPVFFAPWALNGPGSHKRLTLMYPATDLLIVPAMWRRFLPAAIRIQELMATELGQLLEITIDLTVPDDTAADVEHAGQGASSNRNVTLESLVGWIDFCRNLFGAFPALASVQSARDPQAASDASSQAFDMLIEYPPVSGVSQSNGSTEPVSNEQLSRMARLRIRDDNTVAVKMSPSEFVSDVLAASECGLDSNSCSSTAESIRASVPRIEFRCERGIAEMKSGSRVQWQADSTEAIHETLPGERSEEEIMLDIFCRRVVGGLVPVADLNDILRPIQLLRSCLES